MAQQLAKKMLGGGEGPENASAIEYFDSLSMGGWEGPENASAIEYFDTLPMGGRELAPVAPAAFSGSGDYGIWTSLPEPVAGAAAVRRKKAA